MGKVEKDRTAGFIEVDHEGLDLPEGNHIGQDEKSRERMDKLDSPELDHEGQNGKVRERMDF